MAADLEILRDAVQKIPISVLRLPRETWENLNSARNGLSSFTVTRPHHEFEGLKLRSLVLMFPDLDELALYLGVVRSNQSIATLDTRAGIFPSVKLQPALATEVAALLKPETLRRTFLSRIDNDHTVARLTPTISRAIVDALWDDEENRRGLGFLARALGPKTFRDGFALQQEALDLALKFFAPKVSDPVRTVIPRASETNLSMWLLEDTVIEHDARSVPGMALVRSDITGFAEFEGGGDRLRVYKANKRPLEALFGVDLLYLNLNIRNMVLVQYKMLERSQSSTGGDWIYRPDAQLDEEIARMDRFRQPAQAAATSYRLNPEGFYMRFVKRERQVPALLRSQCPSTTSKLSEPTHQEARAAAFASPTKR